nr:copia protein [Tanacetum cinerariifolium]GEY60293.1 copia protein [Tanacetum cinerariifolium]
NAGNQNNGNAGTKANINAGQDRMKTVPGPQYVLLPLLTSYSQGPKSSEDKVVNDTRKKSTKVPRKENVVEAPEKEYKDANGNRMFTHVSATGSTYVNLEDTADLQDTRIFSGAYDDEVEDVVADFHHLELITVFKDNQSQGLSELLICLFSLTNKTQEGDSSFDRSKLDRGNKQKDKRGIKVRNNARLVAQGYTQEEGFDYDEVFAPVARIEAIRLFLAHASFMGFLVYQMDVKSVFLYVIIEEEAYVCQPLGFEDPHFLDKVYKVEKPYMVSVKLLKPEFEGLMHKKFQKSSMGELTFFLGLQVMQRDDGIFISQDKYVADLLKKFDFSLVKISSTPIETNKAFLKDQEAKDMDVHLYRLMIRSFMYLKASRPDIMDSPFNLEAFSDSDSARASLDRKSTTGGCQFLRKRLISWQCKKQTVVANSTTKPDYVTAANYCGQYILDNMVKHLESKVKFLMYPRFVQVFLDNQVEAPEDMGEGSKIPNDPYHIPILTQPSSSLPQKKQKSRRKQRKEIKVPSPSSKIPNKEGVPITSNDPLPSGEDKMQLNELMILCTNLQKHVLDLEKAKTAQAKEIACLKKESRDWNKKGSQEL